MNIVRIKTKIRQSCTLARLASIFMALVILLSVMTPMWIGINSFAAADSEFTGDIYVDISQNDALKSIVANNGRLVALSDTGEVALGPVTGSNNLYRANGTFSTTIKIKGDPQPTDGTSRIYLDLTKSIENGETWSTPKVYCWNFTRGVNDFPGEEMKKLCGNYYFCDYSTVQGYAGLLFNSGESSAQYQTVDLYVSGWTADTPMFQLGDKETEEGINNGKYNGNWVAVDQIKIETAAFNLSERDSNTSNKITIDASGAGTWGVYGGSSSEDLASESVDYTVTEDNFSDADVITSSGGVEILGVDTTYYDYLSDVERSGGWRTKTEGKDGGEDWKKANPFQIFNAELDQYYKDQTAAQAETWGIPLYFGNFYPSLGNYTSANALLNLDHGLLTGDSNNKRYFLAAQNSNYLNSPGLGTLDSDGGNAERYRQAYQGLVHDKLVNGKLMVGDNGKIVAPWFNNEWLQTDPDSSNERAKIIKAKFPFVAREVGSSGNIKEYSFHSSGTSGTDAKDNVYFTWDGSSGAPLKVNYGQGARYGLRGTDNNFGVFPFNTPNGSGNQTEEGIDYGFGIKMEMEFYLPKNGMYDASTPAKFKYSADDDLWVFVDDELVLDVGGNHSWCDAEISFGSENGDRIKGTVNRVFAKYNSDNSVTEIYSGEIKSAEKEVFINTSDVNKKHKLTIFYMERGLGSSNFKAGFTMIPATSNLGVKNKVNVEAINVGLQKQVQDLGVFNYTATQTKSGSETTGPKTVSKTVCNIGHDGGDRFDTSEFVKSTKEEEKIFITQEESKPIKLSYTTASEIVDQLDGNSQIEKGVSHTVDGFGFINKSGNTKDAVDLQANFTNTFDAAPLYLKKEVEVNEEDNKYYSESDREHYFNYKISVKLDDGGGFISPTDGTNGLEYYYVDAAGNKSGVSKSTGTDGSFSIKRDDHIMFDGMPVGSEVKIEEVGNTDTYTVKSIIVNDGTPEENKNTVSFDIRATTEGKNSIVYTNSYNAVLVNLTATKNFNGEPYDNSKETHKNRKAFKYTVTPVGHDSSGKDPDFLAGNVCKTTSVKDGAIQFDPIVLKNTGRYIYKISEDFSEEVPVDKRGLCIMDEKIYYAQVDVDKADAAAGAGTDAEAFKVSLGYYKEISSTTYECTTPISGIVWNNVACVNVSFTKVDESGNALSGVRFEVCHGGVSQDGIPYEDGLYTKDAFGNPIGNEGVVTSGPDGVVRVDNMGYDPYDPDRPETIYHFVEKQALPGHQLPTGPVVVKIKNDGTYTLSYKKADIPIPEDTLDGTVTNLCKPNLPATGGIGVVLLYIFGSIIVVGSGLAYVLYKKKINPISAIRTFFRK